MKFFIRLVAGSRIKLEQMIIKLTDNLPPPPYARTKFWLYRVNRYPRSRNPCKRISNRGTQVIDPSSYRVCLPPATLQSVRSRPLLHRLHSERKRGQQALDNGGVERGKPWGLWSFFFFLTTTRMVNVVWTTQSVLHFNLHSRDTRRPVCLSPSSVSRGLRRKSRLVYAATVNRPS